MDDAVASLFGIGLALGALLTGLLVWIGSPEYDKIITQQVCQPRCQAGEVAKMELKENKILCFCSQTTER